MTLGLRELTDCKTKALFDRLAVRDLYDIYRIQTDGLPTSLAGEDADLYRLQRRVRIYYASLSKPFPCSIDGNVVDKFADRAAAIEHDLYPVLHVGDRPSLEAMMRAAVRYIDDHVAPKEDEEDEYLHRLGADSEYVPKLLFSPWPKVLERAVASPAASWKVVNLRKRPNEPVSDYPEW